jgi:methionine synthase II (cobalamin-independent)
MTVRLIGTYPPRDGTDDDPLLLDVDDGEVRAALLEVADLVGPQLPYVPMEIGRRLPLPAGERVRVLVHLCYGSSNNRSAVKGRLQPLVALANAIAAAVPRVEEIHLPIGDAGRPAPLDGRRSAAFYRPLRRLRPGTRIAAGLVHHRLPAPDAARALDRVRRDHAGPVAVSTPCGLRMSREAARETLRTLEHLATASERSAERS